jgi:translocation protein SEC62
MSDATTFYGEEKNLKALCDFLRSSEGPAVREAIEMDKRVYYLKGESSKHLIDRFPRWQFNGTSSSHVIVVSSSSFHPVGEKLVNFMVEPKKGTKWPKNLPKFKNRTEAIAVCKELCNYQYMHRSIKRGKGDLVVSDLSRVASSPIKPFTIPNVSTSMPTRTHFVFIFTAVFP